MNKLGKEESVQNNCLDNLTTLVITPILFDRKVGSIGRKSNLFT